MRREFQVRFCEGLGVRFPQATRRVLVFEQERDARRMLAALPKRFGRFGLRLHPEKTRLVWFGRPPLRQGGGHRSQPRPCSFDFLGFTHYWGRSRKGSWVVKQRTARSRFTRTVRALRVWCREHRHLPLPAQQATLAQKLRGHFNYYGVTGNSRALSRVHLEAKRAWRKWLSRRSQRGRLTWERFQDLLERYPLSPPRLMANAHRPVVKPVL